MGWAIKRSDGTYRAWNSNAQDDTLQPGEVWVALDQPPVILVPRPPSPNPLKAIIASALSSTDVPPVLKAVLSAWNSQL